MPTKLTTYLFRWTARAAALTLYLLLIRAISESAWVWSEMIRVLLFSSAAVLLADVWQPWMSSDRRWIYPWPKLVLLLVGTLVGLLYAYAQATGAAWLITLIVYSVLLDADALFAQTWAWQRWLARGCLAILAGGGLAAITQIESRFSDEEFFVALQALALSGFWLLLVLLRRHGGAGGVHNVTRGAHIQPRRVAVLFGLVASVGTLGVARSYQQSFYPATAPLFTGVSADNPFICRTLSSTSEAMDGRREFQRLLARVAAYQRKGPPEYAMLALGSGERSWAVSFRDSLLAEVQEGVFTEAANSVKSVQHEAAYRAYYYPRMQQAFPDLFTAEEDQQIRDWFAAINRRALTVEWVDWLYAVAFTKAPEGPYENQESGAGLLAVLEAGGLSTPELSVRNRDYLQRYQRGWAERFRNTDDAIIYQPEWITNALFQQLYTGAAPQANIERSFEWLLLQAKPDGTPLQYNHPYAHSMADIAYLGAKLTNDPRYLWLASRALDDLEAKNLPLLAQPGLESSVIFTDQTPDVGTCLLYGDSGLPTQVGPLAPDKVVFRTGWSRDSLYAMLNLRFTGWHRYKATNTLTLVYNGAPLVSEGTTTTPYAWLPRGRSFFRDKRMPREQLNGLVVERSGLSAVLYLLTGMGGMWAQDPPFYASIKDVDLSPAADTVITEIDDWRGWNHRRMVSLGRSGPLVVVDHAVGPAGQRGAITWQLMAGQPTPEEHRFKLQQGATPAELFVLPVEAGATTVDQGEGGASQPNIQLRYDASEHGRLQLISIFLTGDWIGAEARLEQTAMNRVLHIQKGAQTIQVPVPQRSFMEP